MTKTGTLNYRAPESFRSLYDEKVDIWAIGVIAYQLFTGKLPFESEFDKDAIQRILKEEPNYDEVSVWEKELLEKLLKKKPEERATTAEALSSMYFLLNANEKSSNTTCSQSLISPPSLARSPSFEDFDKK